MVILGGAVVSYERGTPVMGVRLGPGWTFACAGISEDSIGSRSSSHPTSRGLLDLPAQTFLLPTTQTWISYESSSPPDTAIERGCRAVFQCSSTSDVRCGEPSGLAQLLLPQQLGKGRCEHVGGLRRLVTGSVGANKPSSRSWQRCSGEPADLAQILLPQQLRKRGCEQVGNRSRRTRLQLSFIYLHIHTCGITTLAPLWHRSVVLRPFIRGPLRRRRHCS